LREAIAAYHSALALCPHAAEVHLNLANAQFALGEPAAAAESYRRVLHLQPFHAAARRGMQTAQAHDMLANRRWHDAAEAYARLTNDFPGIAAMQVGLGIALWQSEDLEGSAAALAAARRIDAPDRSAAGEFGALLNAHGLWTEALAWFARYFERGGSRTASVLTEYASALYFSGGFGEALQLLNEVLSRDPKNRRARYHRSFVHLMLGRMHEGFADFEERFAPGFVYPQGRPSFAMPPWQGEDLSNRHLLVWTDQGMGDALQFARYLPALRARCIGKLSVRVHGPLASLLQASFQDLDLESSAVPTEAAPDYECALMSLPLRLGSEADPLPVPIPYLRIPQDRRLVWEARLPRGSRLRIGLAWAGHPDQARNRARSMPFSTLAPLCRTDAVPGLECEFHVIQQGAALAQLDDFAALPLVRSCDACSDFADTAALMAQLDLIITVDTSVAHLAAAIGRPTWIMLARVPDWRYGMERQSCAWYPGARLFRQPTEGDWPSVIQAIQGALCELSADSHPAYPLLSS
jgi:tetratricopeptide (TPR) repeat protein